MKETFFWCYPWDLEDEGIDAALGRMAGEIGVDAVSVATTHHSIEAFRPRAPAGRRTVTLDAAAHFQPDRACYVNTRVRPIPAAWMKSRNPLDKISRHAQKLGLKLRAWAVCCHGSAMAARFPMASCVDAFGQTVSTWLCPSHPDVREYVAALVEDLSRNYPAETIELESAGFAPAQHHHRHLRSAMTPSPADRAILSWCFCSSCRQRATDAGIDVETVLTCVTDRIDRMMRLVPAEASSLEAALAESEPLAAYHRMRVETVASLLKAVRDRSTARLVVHVGSEAGPAGDDLASLAGACDGLVISDVMARSPNLDEALEAAAWSAACIDVMQPCYPPHVEDEPALISTVHGMARAGYAGIGFFNYGLAPAPCLEWVRRAVRYARREATP